MSLYRIFEDSSPEKQVKPIRWTRELILEEVRRRARFDLVIVGGGIHGAALARLSALNGLSVLLLERGDYAEGTSGRTSKMAHGGLRYLGMGDVRQVLEGVRAREDLLHTAPHLVRPAAFLIPIRRGDWWGRVSMGIGLTAYDLLLKDRAKRHTWFGAHASESQVFQNYPAALNGAYRYFDGIMADGRLVQEIVVSARQEGALALNYAEVVSTTHRLGGEVEVGWRNVLNGETHEVRCGLVLNCAGPWAPGLGRLRGENPALPVKYSRGAHVIFSTPWRAPALFLPLERRHQYYFVWPHWAGTMVGTTEREVAYPERDPLPTSDEVGEILQRIERDLPGSGLDRKHALYAFAGVRTLPMRRQGSTLSLSRRHQWSFVNGMLTLVGGKFTTAAWTAVEGLRRVFELSGISRPIEGTRGRLLPGAANLGTHVEEFLSAARAAAIPEPLAAAAVRRWGGRVSEFRDWSDGLELVGNSVLAGELRLAVHIEQAETLEDVLRRRLELEYDPVALDAALPAVADWLNTNAGKSITADEIMRYRERIAAVRRVLRE